ncbi:46 kDa FK506-binding nuclear protein [Cimex lectularius]|uniref:FK506-binding protein n=1 Tax=Cimex lectularius TaxID=79782 RepID=A0A8I6TES2_CIMLE|nr:46 kDa FK506-binding nuclear protein [Cimex lectularius]
MFWGLRLDPGKRYSTTVDKSFHVSMAALDCTTLKTDDDVLSVMLEEGESTVPFILCNLQKQKALQCALDLNFLTGDRITFFCKGNGVVHLSGYIVPEDEFGPFESEEGDDEEEEDEEESIDNSMSSDKGEKKGKLNGVADKRKLKQVGPANKKQTKLEDYSGDDSEESDGDDLNLEDEDDDDEEEEEESDDNKEMSLDWDDSDDSDEDSNKDDVEGSDEEREQVPHVTSQQKKDKKKKKKKQPQQPQSQQSTPKPQQQQQQQQQKKQKTPNGVLPNAQQGKKDKKGETLTSSANKLNKSKTEDSSPQKKTVEGGVQIKDIKVGNGPVCARGKQATVYYTGRFKNNNKIFDSTTQGSGFKFRVGKGDVIKGWDVGVVGMKVGGKRLITCPPHMAYGQKGSPPTIPGNSTLMFEVELKSVN